MRILLLLLFVSCVLAAPIAHNDHEKKIDLQSVSSPCIDPTFSPTASLDSSKDAIQPGEFAVTTRSTLVCHVDPDGYSTDAELYTLYGFPVPWSQTGSDGTGRKVCYYDFCPTLRSTASNYRKADLFNIPAALFEEFNMSVPVVDAPVIDGKLAFIIVANGYGDNFLEYYRYYMALVLKGNVCARMIAQHPGDFTLNPFSDTEIIMTERVNDINYGIDLALNEAYNQHGSFFYGHIDRNKVICAAHSLGGAACIATNVGSSLYNISPNHHVKGLMLQDPSTFIFPYADLKKLNIPSLTIDSQNALSTQGIIRNRNANKNPINHSFYTKYSVHQMFQINACLLSQLSVAGGYVNNSFGWAFAGDYSVAYCVSKDCLPETTHQYGALQGHFNATISYSSLWLEAYFYDDERAQEAFSNDKIEEVQQSGALGIDFVHVGPEKCGNCTWVNVTSAIETNRDEFFYATYYSSSSDFIDFLFTSNPLLVYYTDCSENCPYTCIENIHNGKNASEIIQATPEFLDHCDHQD